MAGASARPRHVDTGAVIAAYESGLEVRAIRDEHRIGWTTLYRILDDHHIPRRGPEHAAHLPLAVVDKIVEALHDGGGSGDESGTRIAAVGIIEERMSVQN